MNRLLIFLAGGLWLFMCAGTVLAELPEEVVLRGAGFRVAVLRDFPPLYMEDSQGRPTGFAIELLETISKESGFVVEYVPTENWGTAAQLVRSGKADFVPGFGINDYRLSEFTFSVPMESIPVRAFVKRDDNRIRRISDLANNQFRTAVINEGAAHVELSQRGGYNLVLKNNVDEGLNALLAGVDDAFIFPEPVLLQKLRSMELEGFVQAIDEPLLTLKRGYLFREGDVHLQSFNTILTTLVDSPAYAKLLKKWYGTPAPFLTVKKAVVYMLVLVGALSILLVVWKNYSVGRINKRLQKLASHLPGVIYQFQLFPDGTSGLPYASEALPTIYGLHPEDVKTDAAAIFAAVHPLDREEFTTSIQQSAKTLEPWRNQHRVLHPSGDVIWVEGHSTPERRPDGSTLWHGYAQDITERKQAAEATRLQAQRTESLLELSRLADNFDEREFMQRSMELVENLTGSQISFIHLINEGGEEIELVAWSRRTLERFCTATYDSHYPVSKAGIWADALRGSKPVIFNDYSGYPHKKGLPEGHSVMQRLISVPVVDNGVVVLLAGIGNKKTDYTSFDSETVQLFSDSIWRIVKEARTAEANKKASEQLALLSKNVPGMIYQFALRTDGSSYFPYASEGIRDIYGVSPERAVEDATLVFEVLHPDDLGRVTETIQESARSLTDWHDIYRVSLPEGRTIWVEGEATPQVLADGSILWHGNIRDITERKQAELQLKQQKTQLEQRNRALRQFNYAVSHELKTPLVSIESSLGLIQSTLPHTTDPELTTVFGYARHATRQMNNLLESLLLMFRIDAADSDTETAFGALVQDAVDQLNRVNKLKGIKLIIAPEGPGLRGDRHKLVQIWLQLIENAAKFMGDQKHPAIAIGIEQTEQEVLFYVRDNGMGIEQSCQGKIFGLFDQLDKTASGTGLGLTLVQRIVDYYGGTIRVASEGLGKGSCFYFTLPDVLINKDMTR